MHVGGTEFDALDRVGAKVNSEETVGALLSGTSAIAGDARVNVFER